LIFTMLAKIAIQIEVGGTTHPEGRH